MDFVWTAAFCCLAWLSGALFGAWASNRRAKRSERRQRSSYFETEADALRPLRRMARRTVSFGVALASLLLVLAVAYILSAPRPNKHVNLRGRVSLYHPITLPRAQPAFRLIA